MITLNLDRATSLSIFERMLLIRHFEEAAPIIRVARPNIPTPFSLPLEQAITPTAEPICAAVRKTVAWS